MRRRRVHLPMLLISAVMALAIKVAVHESDEVSTQTLPVRVQNKMPAGFIVMQSTDEVLVQIRGPSSAMAQLNPLTLRVDAEVPVTEPGFVEVVLEPDDVVKPNDFEVLSIQPNRFTVEVDREVTRRLPIEVDLTGEPAAGAQVGTWEVRPTILEVIGPSKLVSNLESLVATVSVDRRAIPFEAEVTPTLPDPTVRFTQRGRVVVQVSFVEPELSDFGGGGDDPGEAARGSQ